MQTTLEDFFKALRGATLEPSLDSEIDASRAVSLIGWHDRELLKSALGSTLAKSLLEREIFDEAFERFFAFDAFAGMPPPDPDSEQSSADAADGADEGRDDGPGDGADGQTRPEDHPEGSDAPERDDPAIGEGEGGNDGSGSADGRSGGGGGGGSAARAGVDAAALADLLLRGDQAELARRLAVAARAVGITDIWIRTQRGWYTQRIQQEMGARDLDRAIDAAEQGGPSARGTRLRQARERLFTEVRAFVERQLALYAAAPTRAMQEEFLRTKPLSAIERRDLPRVREIVQKLARKLAARHARRSRHTRRGELDVRRTMRHNAAYGGVLFEPVWRTEVVDRPRVIVICDVSGSVSAYARFLLLFVYSLQELMSGLRSFAFISDLVEVSDLFATMPLERAVDEVMRSVGGSGSDYGRMLEDVDDRLLADIDRKTTVLILGDARNNGGEPRVPLLEAIHRRARRLVWLNPEARSSWGYGDSEMLRYAVHCDLVRPCRSLHDFERMLDHLLRPGQANA